MIPTVQVSGGWESVLEGAAWREMERSVLPKFLQAQRWFGGKGRRLLGVQLADWGEFPTAVRRAFLLLLHMRFADGKNDLYFLPLGVTSGEAATRMLRENERFVLARLTGHEGEALLHDFLADDDSCAALLRAIDGRRQFAMRSGQVRAFPTAAYARLRGSPEEELCVIRGPATSSNSLIFYGRRLLLKLFRRLETGVNPDFEIGRFLTEGNVFTRLPHTAGAIEYQRDGWEPITLAILQASVANQGDGWRHALGELEDYYKRASASCQTPENGERLIGSYMEAAENLGRRTAELHHALADASNPEFAPEPFTAADAAALHKSIREQGQSAVAILRENLEKLASDVALSARQLLDEGSRFLKHLDGASPVRVQAAKIRCHGDYHLGQVLRVENDYVILDFEGEPVRTVQERRAKQSPLKDVAGMLRSYHYAAYAGLFAFAHDRPEDFARLEPWAELWFRCVSAAFLRSYRAAAHNADFLPHDGAQLIALLDAFMLDKAFYELNYELNNRPDWVRIPLRGILSLLSEIEQTNPARVKGRTS